LALFHGDFPSAVAALDAAPPDEKVMRVLYYRDKLDNIACLVHCTGQSVIWICAISMLSVTVARTRNFRRAALEQHVSVSGLGQRLRDLEERLGVRLMNRTTHSVGLTEAGELLLARIGPAMSDVAASLVTQNGPAFDAPGGERFCCTRFALIKRA
jgi:Bacterial regulatory helix-turn-helix protein, lysR family